MLLGIVLVVAVTNASAQDLIVLNSDAVEEMQVKVVEVSDSEVKYKKWSYQDGPTFSLSTDKILYIKYQNGEKQRFDKQGESVKPIEETVATPQATNLAFETTTVQTEAAPKVEVNENEDKYFSRKKGVWSVDYSLSYMIPGGDEDYDESFYLGLEYKARYNVAKGLNVHAGLGFMTGYVAVGSGSYRTTIDESSLTLPLGVGYNLPLGSLCSLDFRTGPRLNYIIAGKIDYDGEEIKYKDLEEYGMEVKRFNAGWDIGVALMFANYGVKFEYSAGLSDSAYDYTKIGFYMLF